MAKRESSLRRFDRLADRIRAHRQVDTRPVVVVEGASDERLVKGLLPEGSAVFFRGNTRSIVLDVAQEAAPLGLDRIACLVDRDFDDLVLAAEMSGWPVVAYDGADLEHMLFESPAATRVVDELGSEPKLRESGGAKQVLAQVRDNASAVAHVRRASAVLGLGLRFDAVDLHKKVDRATLLVDMPSYCAALVQASETDLSAADVEQHAARHRDAVCPHTAKPLIRGRDALNILGVSLRRLIGTLRKEQADPELLAASLRASADREWLLTTPWYSRLLILLDMTGSAVAVAAT